MTYKVMSERGSIFLEYAEKRGRVFRHGMLTLSDETTAKIIAILSKDYYCFSWIYKILGEVNFDKILIKRKEGAIYRMHNRWKISKIATTSLMDLFNSLIST